MKVKRIALLCVLILSGLPCTAPVNCQNSGVAGVGGGSSPSASIARSAVGTNANLIESAQTGSSRTEASAGLLLLMGLGLIGAASLIDIRMRRTGPAEEADITWKYGDILQTNLEPLRSTRSLHHTHAH